MLEKYSHGLDQFVDIIRKYWYEVPDFQRPFVWKTINANEMWEDIINSREDDPLFLEP